MKTIKRFDLAGNSITVTQTNDAQYARDCFDGSAREWEEIETESSGEFFIVACGLSGCYMSDDVSVFPARETALQYARDTFEMWQEMEDEESV